MTSALKKINLRLARKALHLILKITSTQKFRKFINQEWSTKSNKETLSPGSVEERILNDLKKDGIALTDIDELFAEEAPTLIQEINEYLKKIQTETPHRRKDKNFLEAYWEDPYKILLDGNPFEKIALESRILSIVNSYLQTKSILYNLTLNKTTPNKQTEPQSSQRWHRDPEDVEMCKLFIYINDVGIENGPFCYVRGSHRRGVLGFLAQQNRPYGSHPNDPETLKILEKTGTSFPGKSGTVIFADTAGIHKGGLAESGQRIMFTAGYFARSSPWEKRVLQEFANDKNLALLNQSQRLAITQKQNFLLLQINKIFIKLRF